MQNILSLFFVHRKTGREDKVNFLKSKKSPTINLKEIDTSYIQSKLENIKPVSVDLDKHTVPNLDYTILGNKENDLLNHLFEYKNESTNTIDDFFVFYSENKHLLKSGKTLKLDIKNFDKNLTDDFCVIDGLSYKIGQKESLIFCINNMKISIDDKKKNTLILNTCGAGKTLVLDLTCRLVIDNNIGNVIFCSPSNVIEVFKHEHPIKGLRSLDFYDLSDLKQWKTNKGILFVKEVLKNYLNKKVNFLILLLFLSLMNLI